MSVVTGPRDCYHVVLASLQMRPSAIAVHKSQSFQEIPNSRSCSLKTKKLVEVHAGSRLVKKRQALIGSSAFLFPM